MRSAALLLLLTLLSIFASSPAYAIDAVEIRGAVAGVVNGQSNLVDNSFTWGPQNFAGFYFDLDKDLSTESLQLSLSNKNVETGAIEYKTYPKPTKFEHGHLGQLPGTVLLGTEVFCRISRRLSDCKGLEFFGKRQDS